MRCVKCGKNEAIDCATICLNCLASNVKNSGKYVLMRVMYDMLDKPMTIREISEKIGVNRHTVRKYLVILYENGWIIRRWRLINGKWTYLWSKS